MVKINPAHNSIAPQSTGTTNVGWGDARNPNISTGTPFGFVPHPNLHGLASILDAELLRIERMDSDIVSQIEKSETLRQSILKKAFSGQLVPQDPNDEPASVFLKRIRVENFRGLVE
jgi:hypothetical protein